MQKQFHPTACFGRGAGQTEHFLELQGQDMDFPGNGENAVNF
jgi:hypothetical protein